MLCLLHMCSMAYETGSTSAFSIPHRSAACPTTTYRHSRTPGVITDQLQSELQLGRLVGPLPPAHASVVHVSPMGLVPKPHSDKWRLIVDLSSPRGRSVNDGISSALCSLQYASVDNAVDIIRCLGQSTELVKLDLSNAYRIVPVHPDDQPWLGVRWQALIALCRLVSDHPRRFLMQWLIC